MLRNRLSKALSTGFCSLVAVSLLSVSVAQPYSDSSFAISNVTVSAGTLNAAARPKIRTRPSPRKMIAAVSQRTAKAAPSVPAPALLPAVVNSDISPHHQELADNTLRALPSPCRNNLKNFYVRYINVTSRGLGGKTTIILDGTVNDAEFAALLTHECGHVTHANIQGSKASGESAFRDGSDIFYNDSPAAAFFAISWSTENILKAKATKQDFVSGYAQSDAFEDFAETFAMYILHRGAFEERAKTNAAIAAKLQWMKQHLPVDENSLGTSQYGWDKKVPWDVTKLPYTLATFVAGK